jgi:ELWxxDGT repeat protein
VVANVAVQAPLVNVNGTLYFRGNNGGFNGEGLWKSNGTSAGTMLISSIIPEWFANLNGTLIFSGSDAILKSDGTTSGTVFVKSFYPSSNPEYLTTVGGTVYFDAGDSTHGIELWKTDGTAAGTQIVSDVYAGSRSSFPEPMVNVNGTLFFSAYDGTSTQLWKTDGTATGTIALKAVSPGDLTNVNGTLYFSANGSVWKSDGTPGGTAVVKTGLYSWGGLTNVGGTLFFAANDNVSGSRQCSVQTQERRVPTDVGTGVDLVALLNTDLVPAQKKPIDEGSIDDR